jgi:hypothetical protein
MEIFHNKIISAHTGENLSKTFCRFFDAKSSLNRFRVHEPGQLIGVQDLAHFAEEPRLSRNPTVPEKRSGNRDFGRFSHISCKDWRF